MRHNIPAGPVALRLLMDGNPDDLTPKTIALLLSDVKHLAIKAKQDPASPMGKSLRENGIIRLEIGTSGRNYTWGAATQEDLDGLEEIQRVKRWHGSLDLMLDDMSIAIKNAWHMQAMINLISSDDDATAKLFAKQKMVKEARKNGKTTSVVSKFLEVVFRGDNCIWSAMATWASWCREVDELERAEKEVAAEKAAQVKAERAAARAAAEAEKQRLREDTDRIRKETERLAKMAEESRAELAALKTVAEKPTEAPVEPVAEKPVEAVQVEAIASITPAEAASPTVPEGVLDALKGMSAEQLAAIVAAAKAKEGNNTAS